MPKIITVKNNNKYNPPSKRKSNINPNNKQKDSKQLKQVKTIGFKNNNNKKNNNARNKLNNNDYKTIIIKK